MIGLALDWPTAAVIVGVGLGFLAEWREQRNNESLGLRVALLEGERGALAERVQALEVRLDAIASKGGADAP